MRSIPFQRHRFTLVEMLVVIAIIGILAALLTPSLRKALDSAYRLRCANNVRQVGIGLVNYANDFNGNLPPHRIGNDYNYSPYGEFLVWKNNTARLKDFFNVVHPAYINDPQLFFCPQSTDAIYPRDWNGRYWPNNKGDTTFSAYNYTMYYNWGYKGVTRSMRLNDPGTWSVMFDMASDRETDKRDWPKKKNHYDLGPGYYRAVGQNMLYLNMSVKWLNWFDKGFDGRS